MATPEEPIAPTESPASVWSSDDPVDPAPTMTPGAGAPDDSSATSPSARGTRRNLVIASAVAVLMLGGAIGAFMATRDHDGTTLDVGRTSSERPIPGDDPRGFDPDGDDWTGGGRPQHDEFDDDHEFDEDHGFEDHHEFGEHHGPRRGDHGDDPMDGGPDQTLPSPTTVPIAGT